MRRPDEDTDEPLLFDLPLEPEPPARKRPARPIREEPDLGDLLDDTAPGVPGPAATAKRRERAGLLSRLAAGAADLLVHAAVAVGVLVGCRSMGVRPILDDWPALALFLLSFSFLYTVVPLAFWGHTPGMAWAGLDARNRDGEPLAFDQTARRWIGIILTLLLAGLPLLLALGGRSLSDLLSGSETLSGA